MAAARWREWAHGRVAQQPKAMHHLLPAAVRGPLPPWSHFVPGIGGLAVNAPEWFATNGRGAIGNFLARCAFSRRMQEAACPLLLARSRPKIRYSRILVPVDFSGASLSAAKTVLHAGPGTQLVFLASFSMSDQRAHHARPCQATTVPSMADACRTARARLARFVGQLDVQASLVSVVARHGTLGAVTRSYARLMRAELVVLGRGPVPQSEGALLAAHGWRLSREIAGDVLVVPELSV